MNWSVRGLFAGLVLVLMVAISAVAIAQAPPGPAAVPADAKKMKNPVASTAASIEAGGVLYQKYCSFCHGKTAKGDSPTAPKTMQPSNLTDSTWVRGSSEGEIFWVIQNGAPPKYDMKGLKARLSEPDTWNVVNFVRSLGGVPKSH